MAAEESNEVGDNQEVVVVPLVVQVFNQLNHSFFLHNIFCAN